MDVSVSTIWTVAGIAVLVILAVIVAATLRRRSDTLPSGPVKIEPTTRPSWVQPARYDDDDDGGEPPLPTDYGTWTPTVACSDRGEFVVQAIEADGTYSVRGSDADVDCELTFHLHVSNAVGDAFVDGIPVFSANDIEVTDASLEELEGTGRDNIPLRAVIFKNNTRLYLGISGREFRPGPTYRLRFRAGYEAAAD